MRFTWALCILLPAAFVMHAQTSVSGDTKERIKAVRELGKKDSQAIPSIEPYLSDGDRDVRVEAVKSVVGIGTQYSLDPLVRAARDNDPEIQIRATDGLVNFYLPGYVKSGLSGRVTRVSSRIKGYFDKRNDQVIDSYIPVRPEVVKALGTLAKGGASMTARANAARGVGILRGRAAVPDLVEAAHSKDNDVIFESLIALQKIRDQSAGPKIAFLLKDLDTDVQIAALETTGLLQNKEAAPEVRRALGAAKSPKVKRAALSALAMLATSEDHSIFEQYLVDRKDHDLRAAAAEGLGRLRNPADYPALEREFNETDNNPKARLAAAFALVNTGKIDTAEFSPLRYLVNSLNSKDRSDTAKAYLVELCRKQEVRQAVIPLLAGATKDEKLHLGEVFARSGEKDVIPTLEALSRDPDLDVANSATRSLKTIRARLP